MGTSRLNGSLYTKIQNKIATIEFGHPAGNSFVLELLERLTSEFQKLSDNDTITLIVLKSEGEGPFCGGASFDELMAVSTLAEGKVFFSGFANLINAMRKCKKVIVGRVQGKAVGGGVGLIAACDYVFATDAAAIRLSELGIGLAPLVIAPAVERKIGIAALAELSLAPTEWKNAYWAQQKGLYAKVFEGLKELDKELAFFTEKLASHNPEALVEWKKVLWQQTAHWDTLLVERAEMSGKLVLSEFAKKELVAFKS